MCWGNIVLKHYISFRCTIPLICIVHCVLTTQSLVSFPHPVFDPLCPIHLPPTPPPPVTTTPLSTSMSWFGLSVCCFVFHIPYMSEIIWGSSGKPF